jgi:hypothetical protein
MTPLPELADLRAERRPGHCIMCDESAVTRLFCALPECRAEYKRIYHRVYKASRPHARKNTWLQVVVWSREVKSTTPPRPSGWAPPRSRITVRTFDRLRCGHEIETTHLQRGKTVRVCTKCRALA